MKSKYTLVKNLGIYTLYASDGSKVGTSYESPHRRLSIENCRSIEAGYDLEAIFHKKVGVPLNDRASIRYEGFIMGAETILELIGNNNFTKDVMEKAIIKSWYKGAKESYSGKTYITDVDVDNIIDSVKQTEWSVEIEMESNLHIGEVVDESYPKDFPTERPKLDDKGCIILKRK